MNTNPDPYLMFPGISMEEASYLSKAAEDLDDVQRRNFYGLYASKRKNPQDIMLLALLGFIGVSGVHRFVLNQIGMGLLYFFTGGLCLIGTIVDLINHKSLTAEYNQEMALESYNIVKLNIR
jgi:TM2 domain-containing membrane protein YozV